MSSVWGGLGWEQVYLFVGPCCFALSAIATKQCGSRLSSWEKTFIRSVANTLFTLVQLSVGSSKRAKGGQRQSPSASPFAITRPGLLALRGAVGCTAMWFNYEAITTQSR